MNRELFDFGRRNEVYVWPAWLFGPLITFGAFGIVSFGAFALTKQDWGGAVFLLGVGGLLLWSGVQTWRGWRSRP